MERQDLHNALTDAMRGARSPELFDGRVAPGRVKSRLIEAHAPEASADGVGRLLRSVAAPAGLQVEALDDDLWALLGSDDVFFVDRGVPPRRLTFELLILPLRCHSGKCQEP